MGKSSTHEGFHIAMFDCRGVSTKNDGPWPSDFAYAALDPLFGLKYQTNGSSTFALASLLITNRKAVAEVLKIGNL